MIKIAALNRESEEESGSDEEVTKEALEQIALQQYSKALELQRKGNLTDATQLLKDLLDTELLDGVKKPAPGEKIVGPLFNLKYLCYKNLASMLSTADEVEAAIEAYGAAAELDNTDVTLWHRLGLLCMKASRYEMALQSFQRGVDRNPKHWPCLDKIVTLLLGLDYKDECISTIYDTLQLDPGYMRGLVYRRYIYTNYPHVREFLEYLNPMYKWNVKDDDPIDEETAEKLLKEAKQIEEVFIAQQKAEQFKYVLPNLKLHAPITSFTWESVGEALTHMHSYMGENCFSHACRIELIVEIGEKEETVDVVEEVKEPEPEDTSAMEIIEIVSENENNDASEKEKQVTDTEKVESDVEAANESGVPNESAIDSTREPKKKQAARRRSALSLLKEWEWCNKRRSGRKKPVNRRDHLNDNIYDTLRRLVPIFLTPGAILKDKEENQEEINSSTAEKNETPVNDEKVDSETYFGSEQEQTDVKNFINKNTETKHDIIDLLQGYLHILAQKWRIKWPGNLQTIFITANKCYNHHIDTPACTDDKNYQDALHYVAVNLLVQEFAVNQKMNSATEEKQRYDSSVVECIGMILSLKPHYFTETDVSYSVNHLELALRHLWVKLHVYILNRCEDLALECLYQLTYEFEAMGEYQSTYSLPIVNFSFKPIINCHEITEYIQFLERNKKLSTVLDLYERGEFEEVLSIVIDSFEHCKDMTREQEDELSLDFAVQLSVILDAYWALDDANNCMTWSFVCLHEALKHYFRFTSGSSDYERWTLTVVKILTCIEHLITTKDLSVLGVLSRKDLSRGLEDIIRIIGHQVETNTPEMSFGSVTPWIVMHFILQREEDLGRSRTTNDKEEMNLDDVPNPLMVLFIAHEQLGNRGWCCANHGKLLFFILDTVVPRLRSPSLSKSLEQTVQHMEQCVYCLYGHPNRKHKLKYLADHNVAPYPLDWERAQQLYEIFRPPTLPPLEGKISGITADTEQLFHRILALLPAECDPRKYIPEVEKYVKGISNTLPSVPPLLPYRMRDIYYLLGDYYFKKEEGQMACKYNVLDVIVNNDRLESWAELSLAKAVNLERILNSCKNLNNEKDVLNPAKAIIRCFKRTLELDPTHCNMWIEYGIFVYTIHSFCSRMLKQASESLSMEEFEALENQKENMLDSTHTCFTTVLNDLNSSNDTDKSEDSWLHYYMLGKVAEKRNKPPSEYLNYYMQGVQSLQETDATYPLKINYNSPTHLCIEVLELHYRIHASILKYIEQHENKPIPSSVGKIFSTCIEEWQRGPFAKKTKKDGETESENDTKSTGEPIHAANILKRSISDAGEGETQEAKRLKTESAAAKVRRSASYDTERFNKDQSEQKISQPETADSVQSDKDVINVETNKPEPIAVSSDNVKIATDQKPASEKLEITDVIKEQIKPSEEEKKPESSSSSSSSSSSGSSSSDSSSDSSSESSRDSEASTTPTIEKSLSEEDIMKIVSACLDALEDCASRFPPHYKAIYRLAHYHFYYKKGKDIERCRDLMLSMYTSRAGPKLGGMFSERKVTNFFNNIWKIPLAEVDRAGSFAFHMNRSVLLTMEILKEIDDHKTLLDLSLHLLRIPEPDKKYLRDSDREDLAQQAFSLCVQSLKGQLLKFSQQADLKSNEVERQALKSLMLDIYRAYQRVQKQPNSRQFINLLIDAYKLVCTGPITDNMNLVDLSMKYCQSLIQTLKQQATQASLDKNQTAQKKQSVKAAATVTETTKAYTSTVNQSKADNKASSVPTSSTSNASGLPKMSAHDMTAAFQSFLPVLNDSVLSHQTAAALSYLSNISALAGYSGLQNTLQSSMQSSLQNSFQAEFYRQYLSQSMTPFNLPPSKPKQKRGPKPGVPRSVSASASQSKTSKSYHTTHSTGSKTTLTSGVPGPQKPPTATIPIIPGLSKSISISSTSSMSGLPKSTSIASSITGLPKSTSMSSISSTAGMSKPSSSTLSVSGIPILPASGLPKLPASGLPKSISISSASSMTNVPKSGVSNLPKSGASISSKSGVSSLPKSTSMSAGFSKSASSAHGYSKPTSAPFTPSMGTVLPTLPASMTANLTSFGASSHAPSTVHNLPSQAHMSSSSTLSTAMHNKPPMPHSGNSGKTLQEKLAERQKNMPPISLSKLPSSLTITKTSVPKPQPKKPEAKKVDNMPRPKPIASDEVIVLDDD